MPPNGWIKHITRASFDAMNDKIYDGLGYNEMVTDPKTGQPIRRGDLVKTLRYAQPVPHPTNSDMLMVIKGVTRWHPDGTFTEESPDDVPGLLTGQEKASMNGEAFWKTEGFFPDLVSP